MSGSRAIAALAAVVLLAAEAGAAGKDLLPDIAAQQRLPINLEAASSQFDGLANRLTFQKVVITQGLMSIRAERGTVARLDFEESRWFFEGDVVLDNQGARVECDSAELLFEGYQLRSALLSGDPVKLRQDRPGAAPTEGKAGQMTYDVGAATIRLAGDAWLSDGANEVSGERIAYDLAREYVTADSSADGEIRMKIKPPRDQEGKAAP